MAKVKVDDINSGSASTKTTTTPTNKNTNTSKQLSGVRSVVSNVNTSSNTVNKITSSGKVTTPTTTTTKTSGTSVSPYTSSKQPTSTLSTTLDTTNKVGSSTPSMQTVLDNGTKVETKTTPTLDVNNISLSGGRTVAPTQKETTTQENKINQVDASKGKTVAPTEESNKSAQAQLNNIVSQEAKENIEKTREEVNNYSQGHYAWSDDQYNLERLADETENYSRAYNDNLTKFNAEVEKYNNGQSSYSYEQMVQMENELNSQREDLISRINKTQETQDEFVQKYTNSNEIYKDYQTEYDDISKQINDKEIELIQNANKPYEERKDISSELQSLKKKKEEIEEKIKQQDKLKQVNYYDYLQEYGSDEEIASYNKQLAAEDDLLIQRVNHMLQAATVGLANGFVQSGTLLTEVVDAVSGKNNYDPLSDDRLANKLSALQNDLNSYVLAGTDGAYKWGLNSINSLMPFVVTLIATKGLNSVANLGLSSDAIGTLGTHLQGMQVGSSTAMENLKNGESLETSLLQGGIMGAISILTETLGGEGFVNLITSDVGQYFAGLTAKEMVKLTTSDVIYSTIESALSEGTEELYEKVFDSIGNHLVNVITGSNFDTGFNNGDTLANNLLTYGKESANEFAMSFFGSLFYGGYASTKGAIQNNKQYQAALQLMEKADQRIYQLEKMKAELSDELSQQGINIDKNIEEWKASQSVLKDNIKVYEDKSITSEKITEATNEKLATYEESASALIESMKNDVQSIIDTYEKVQADYIQTVGLEYTLLKRAGVNLNGGLEAYENLDESEKENVYKMSKDTQEFAQEIRKKIIFESSEQIREYASKNSGVQKLGQVDGYYNPSDNTYHIATSNTSDIISEIIAHELTHGIEKSASYSKLSELVLTKLLQDNNYTLKENETLWDNPITKQELKKYGKLYEKAGIENANAQSELIAKLVQKEFSNKGFDSLIKYLKDDGIKGYITRKFYDITSGLSKDISKQIENTFNKANYELEMDLREKNLNSNNPSMYSLSSLFGACGLDIAKNENGMIDVEYNGESVKEVTVDMVKDSPLGNLLVADVQHEFITQEEADKQANAFAQLLNMIKSTQSPDLIWAISSGLGFNEANVGDNLSDLKNTVSHALTSNADHQYSSTFDVTTICLKTQQIINVMSELMVKLQRGLTENEIINTVFKEVYNSGESVPCPVCYVFSRWVGLGGLLNNIYTYQNEYENIDVKELEKEFAELEKEVEKIIANSTKKLSGTDARNILRDMLEEESETYIALINEQSQLVNQKSLDLLAKKDFNAQAKLDEVNHKLELMDRWSWIKNVRLNPEYETKGKVDPNVLFNINAGEEFANRFPLAWKYRTTRGAAMGKAVTPYVSEVLGQTIYGASSKNALNKLGQYRTTEKNEFLKGSLTKKAKDRIDLAIKKAKAQNLLGGQRYQSTSDFRFEYVTDYLLHFFELQSIGSYSQGYTKVAEAVSFLASMGAEVNCSLMPLGNGFDKYGNLAFSSVTGMNPDDAFRLSSMYDNVQPIMVGINDDHIIACMKDDRITFIIPYHASGSTEARLLAMMQIVGERINPKDRKSYEKSQNDEVIDESLANVRELRLKILTHKVGTLTQEQRSILANNSYLENLYERFYGERYDGTKVETIDDKCYQVALNKDQAEKIMPFEYWDTSLTIKDANENGRRFVEYCKSLGLKPRFEQFSTYDGYWKLLIDRSMYNVDGTYHEQKPINVSNFSSDMFLRSKMIKGIVQPSKQVDNTKTQTIVDNSLRRLQMDIAETDSDGKTLSQDQRNYFGNSKIVDKNGRLLRLFHGTSNANFTIFDSSYSNDGLSIFLTPDLKTAQTYSGTDKVVDGYHEVKEFKTINDVKDFLKDKGVELRYRNDTIHYGYYLWSKNDNILANFLTNTVNMESYWDVVDAIEIDVRDGCYLVLGDRDNAITFMNELGTINNANYEVYANAVNPLVIDADGSRWSSINYNGNKMTTRELSRYAYDNGYDALIVNNVVDPGGNGFNNEPTTIVVVYNSNQIKSVNNLHPTSDNDIKFNIGNGYDGYSMSNNARAAYLSGEMPESKWTKEKIIREVNNYVNEYKNILNVNEEAISMLPKLRKNELFRLVLSNKGWHHTSEYYNETMFWGISRDKLEELTPEKINNIIANRTNKVVEENPIRKGTIKYLEWGGTRQHPIAYPQTLKGNIQEKGSFYIVTDDNGRQLLRKKIGSNGTSVEYDDIKFDIGNGYEDLNNNAFNSKEAEEFDNYYKNLITETFVKKVAANDFANMQSLSNHLSNQEGNEGYVDLGNNEYDETEAEKYNGYLKETEDKPLGENARNFLAKHLISHENSIEQLSKVEIEYDKQNSEYFDQLAKGNVRDVTEQDMEVAKDTDTTNMISTEMPKLPDNKISVKSLIGKAINKLVTNADAIEKISVFSPSLIGDYWQFRNVDSMVNSTLVNKRIDPKTRQATGESLASLFESLKGKGSEYERDFHNYLLHYRNIDDMSREQFNREIEIAIGGGKTNSQEFITLFKNKPVFGTRTSQYGNYGDATITADDSRQVVQEYEIIYPEFKQLAERFWEYERQELKLLLDYGLIDQADYNLMQKTRPHYIPILREFPETKYKDKGVSSANKAIKESTGSKLMIKPLEYCMEYHTRQVYRSAFANSVYNDLLNTVGTTSYENYVKDNMLDEKDIMPVDEFENFENDMDEFKMETQNKEEERILVAYQNGIKKAFKVSDDIYKSLQPQRIQQIKGLSWINQARRNVLTEFNPAFWVSNPLKDIQDAFANSKHPALMLASLPQAYKEVFTNGEIYQAFIALGGQKSSHFNEKTISDALGKHKNIFSIVQTLNNKVEQATRLAEFIASIKSGESSATAIYNALEVTTNFSRGGDYSKWVNNNLAPFFNASVQGASKFVRNWADAYRNKGIVGVLLYASRLAIAYGVPVVLINHLWHKDDEDYENLADYVKQGYYVLWKVNGKYIRIPKGRVAQFYQTVVENAIDYNENRTLWENFVADLESDFKTGMDTIAPNNPLTSTVIAPLWQAFIDNETWYGDDIVSEWETRPAGEQTSEKTDVFSNTVGKLLNISPLKINYVIDQYLGGWGDVILPLGTPYTKTGTLDPFVNMFGNKFTTDPVFNNQSVTDFYDEIDHLASIYNSGKKNDTDTVAYKYLSSVRSEMSDLYSQKKSIYNNEDLTRQEKYEQAREVQSKIDALAQSALDNISNGYEDMNGNAIIGDRVYAKDEDGDWSRSKSAEKYVDYYTSLDDNGKQSFNSAMDLDGIYKDENGKIYDSKVDGATKVSNSEALETRKALQDIGQYESVLDYIAENGLEYSDFGLSKTVVNYDDSKFNKAYNKVFGTTDTESNKDTTGTKSNNKTSSTGSTQSSSNGNKTSGSTSSTNTTTNSTNTTTSGTSTTKNLDTGKVSAKSTPSVGSKGSSSKVAAEETTSGGSSTMSLGKQNYGSIDLLKKNQSYWEWLLENGLA